jgi:hypothetical protein
MSVMMAAASEQITGTAQFTAARREILRFGQTPRAKAPAMSAERSQ